MSISDLMTDTVKVLKQNGEVIEQVMASVQKNKIFIGRADILIESGDLIQQSMTNGAEETYKVIDPGFHEKFHSIPAGYQMDVKKLGLPEAKSAVQQITYIISGTNNRVNQNSVDNSTNNSVNFSSELSENILVLRNEIKNVGLSKTEQMASNEIIDAIEAEVKNDKPSKTVVQTLLTALPKAGNIASIGSLIVSLLG